MPLAWPCISSQFLLLPVFLFWEVSMIPATMHHSEGREYRVRSLQASSHNIAITQSICNLGLCFLLKHAACNTHCGSMNTELGNSTVAHAWRKLLYIVCQAHHGLPVIGIPRQHPSIIHESHCKQRSHQQKSTKIQGHCTKKTTKRLLAHSRSWPGRQSVTWFPFRGHARQVSDMSHCPVHTDKWPQNLQEIGFWAHGYRSASGSIAYTSEEQGSTVLRWIRRPVKAEVFSFFTLLRYNLHTQKFTLGKQTALWGFSFLVFKLSLHWNMSSSKVGISLILIIFNPLPETAPRHSHAC